MINLHVCKKLTDISSVQCISPDPGFRCGMFFRFKFRQYNILKSPNTRQSQACVLMWTLGIMLIRDVDIEYIVD